ncbi:glucose 1-dehydrogenase [Parahaliea sp. F7430]|uniref:Glucose 1-dehydrogenase n=1 Tax=Sediminihaliea albiluteola TaxID=2758564 RepID=A0A7W2TWY2_9GAMM|nr:glucose 1-dehydrogenase [Sediminihaliea albiluteola]MBA6413339.1 glucose 1-dehydrogenase [Sediminihaliea albiluteola]
MTQFADKVALVTGAANGIGRSVAMMLAERGARVVVADMAPAGEQTAADIRAAGGQAEFVRCDVSDGASVAAMVKAAVTSFGRLDIAVNNAGIDPEVAPTATWEERTIDSILAVNVKGVFLCLKYEIEEMLRTGGGAIVNMGSAAGLVGVANKPAYTASKHAVVGLTKASALQYASQGIAINAVCPGAVDTQMLADNLGDPGLKDMVAANHPIGRVASANDIAEAVIWLCSAQASYVTGHALAVDGGLVIQ